MLRAQLDELIEREHLNPRHYEGHKQFVRKL